MALRDWPLRSAATTGCVVRRRGGHSPSAMEPNDNTTPMQIRARSGFTDLHRRVLFDGPCRGRPVAAPTGCIRAGAVQAGLMARDKTSPAKGRGTARKGGGGVGSDDRAPRKEQQARTTTARRR